MKLDSTTLEGAVQEVLNTLISSDAIQKMTFKTSSGCNNESTLNQINFCDELAVSDSYSTSVIDDACVETCNFLYAAAIEGIDDARKLCKSLCATVDWTCGGCCSDGCQDLSDAEKESANSDLEACLSVCKYLTITGGYDMRVNNIEGAGAIVVTNVYDMQAIVDSNTAFSLSFDIRVGEVKAHASAKVWQDPIPAIAMTETILAENTLGSGTATVTKICGKDGIEDGYYLQLNSISVVIPSDIADTAGLIAFAESIGIAASEITGGIVDLTKMWMDLANGELAKCLMDMMNDLLIDYKIMDCDC